MSVLRLRSRISVALLLIPVCSAFAQLDETWSVTVNGQTTQVRPDGTFFVPNVAAPDQFGAAGPGSPPDFLSDDFLRVVGTSTVDGVTRWVFTEPFQIQQGQTFLVGDLTITETPPPLPISIDATIDDAVLTQIGQTTQVHVTAMLADATSQDVTPRTAWTIYRTSNTAVAAINGDGLVTAAGEGVAHLTATNEGSTAVVTVLVLPGDPLTTVEGFVQFEDGTPAEGADVSFLVIEGSDVTDATGFFSIPGVPTQVSQALTIRAAINVSGESFLGTADNVQPVGGGLTDVGIIKVFVTGGGLGPVVLSGMDPEDHGSAGQDMIRDIMEFVVSESALHAEPDEVAMLGGSTGVANNAAGIAGGLGFTLTHFTGQGILDVDLIPGETTFDAIYMPTSSADISGGITSADMSLINQRGPDIIRFINSGGGLAAFSQNVSGGYGWMPLDGLDTVVVGGTGIELTIAGEFLLSPSAVAVQPFHTAFIGPVGFYGLEVLAIEQFNQQRPLIIGGLASIPPDCNLNGVEDALDLSSGTSQDCNNNGRPDECDGDCNGNGVADECDLADGTSVDVIGDGTSGDGIPDDCQADCNGNLIADDTELADGTGQDCNANGVLDECDVASGTSDDCNGDGVPDDCQLTNCGPPSGACGTGSGDCCVLNGTPGCDCANCCLSVCAIDPFCCDISWDSLCANEAIVDSACPCGAGGGGIDPVDCNENGVLDECDISDGTSADIIGDGAVSDGIPDECQVDCNANLVPDELDIANGTSLDCNGNGVPDECDIASMSSDDCDTNGIPDECQPDCNANGIADTCELADGTGFDCNGNDALDICDIANGTSFDCDGNMRPDECDVLDSGRDDNANGFLDDCETEAIGIVVDSDGLAVEGASLITNGDVTGTSLADGSFSILGVPTFLGDIVVAASAEIAGEPFVGSSAPVPPVVAGTTDVGTVVVAPCAFVTDFGTGLNQSDDDTDFVAFSQGFTFPYFGPIEDGIFINSNGSLTFSSGDTTFSPFIPSTIINGLPRISPAFVDFNPAVAGDVFFNQFPNRFVVTWSNVPLFAAGGSNTFQVILHSDGRIQFIYNGLTANGTEQGAGNDVLDISVAVTPGGTPSLLTVDYSTDPPLSSGAGQAVFENFNSSNLFDLDFSCVLWQPNGSDGFDMSVVSFAPCVPAGIVSGVVTDGDGTPIPNCQIKVTSSGDPNYSATTQSVVDGTFFVDDVPVPGGIYVTASQDTDIIGVASGILWNEGDTLEVIVSPIPPAEKD